MLLILTVITFALAAPAPVQDERRAYVGAVHAPEDVTPELGKRMNPNQEFKALWSLHAPHLKNTPPPAHLPNLPPPPPPPRPPPPTNPGSSSSSSSRNRRAESRSENLNAAGAVNAA
jgi:hypothetical protein